MTEETTVVSPAPTRRRRRKDPDKDPVFMAAITQMVLPLLFVRMKGARHRITIQGKHPSLWNEDERETLEELMDYIRHDESMDFEWSDWAWNDARFDEPPARPRVKGLRSPTKHSRKRRQTYLGAAAMSVEDKETQEWVRVGTCIFTSSYEVKDGKVPRATPPGDRQRGARLRDRTIRAARREALFV